MSEKINITGVNKSDTCEIKFSGHFLHRLHVLYFAYLGQFDKEELDKILLHIGNQTIDKIEDENLMGHTYNVETLIILINQISKTFEELGLVKEVEVEDTESTGESDASESSEKDEESNED